MVEAGIQLRRARESSIGRLDEHMASVHSAESLKGAAGSDRFGRFHAGWKTALEVNGERFELAILVRDSFPFEPPDIYFSDPVALLRFPHVDSKGKLCLTNATATYSPNLVTETADFLIEEARKLICDSIAGRNEEEFVQEFQSYWRLLPGFSSKKFWSLLRPSPPTRSGVYYAAAGFTLFGESEEEIRFWLKNYCGGRLPKGFNLKPTVVVWLKEPLSPKRHPSTAHDVLTLARTTAQSADALLAAAIPPQSGSLPIVLGFDSKAGPVLAGVELSEPKTASRSNSKKHQNSRNFGYRPGHVPKHILLPRYFGDGKIALTEVTRVDAPWCLHRGGNSYDAGLFAKRVALVGCGSLGADVAVMLAKSGVGHFVLVDSDTLNWGNVARHVLGGNQIGTAKASALASYLRQQMPWLQISDESRAVETLVYERPAVLTDCDLLVSTTGDWTSDCVLNAASRTFARFPPVIFGWTEAYGIAGHALALLRSGGCLVCGMNQFGVFDSRVTEWAEGKQPLLQGAGCNDLYQPYGITDVAPIKAIIAELALDVLHDRCRESTLRTWVGDTTRLELNGGTLHGNWSEAVTPCKSDRRTLLQIWAVNPKCPLCN